MIERKRFSGVLDKDSSLFDVLNVHHVGGKNIRFVGNPQSGYQAQNIKGNVVVTNSNLPAGTNECNGAFYDQVRGRIYWFNYNSNGNHGYYYYSIQAGTITQVFRCGVNSASDIFELSLDYPVTSIAVVYSDLGDLHYWTNGYSRPKYMNIDTVATLGTFTDDMINAAKNAPGTPPSSVYRDDSAVNANSLRKKLFRFCYRWIYANNEKSTFSPISEVPLPVGDNLPTIQNDPTKNNNIRVTLYTGGNDTVAVELAVQESLGATWSDFKRAELFDYDDYNLTPSSSFTFDFYNNGGYVLIPAEETDLYFSWLPDKANALDVLNGNVIIYAGITDGAAGLQRDDINVSLTSTLISTNTPYNSCYKWSSTIRYGLQYYDDRNKPVGGVVSFVQDAVDAFDFSVTMPAYNVSGTLAQIPQVSASINHTPPVGATKYEWVRTTNQVCSKFLYYMTNDFQSGNGFLYFGIQNLVEGKSENEGYVPSYEFAQGDRVRVVGYFNTATATFTHFSTQLDFEILGTIERTMTSPANKGLFLKVNAPASIPSPGYILKMLIEIYTPAVDIEDKELVFFEFGEKYDIYTSGGIRYHRGQVQDQTAVQAATFVWTKGDVYYRTRDFGRIAIFSGSIVTRIMDANYSDFFISAVNSNGRAWLIIDDAAETFNGTLLRWGGAYQRGTNIDNLPIFRPNDYDEADRAKGDIIRLKARDRILRVFQQRGLGQYGVWARFIQNNEGVSDLVTTNEIITKDNIQYYQGVYGIGDYSTNLVSTHLADYLTDIITGRSIRLSVDGITDLGLLYKGQYYFPDWVLPYNKNITRSNGARAKVMGYFDSYDNDYHVILQAGTLSGTSYDARHFSFNEGRNGFCCDDYDFKPEWAISAAGVTFAWNSGLLYKHDSSTYCNFFGTQFNAEIELVFNANVWEKKTWQAISEIANSIWEVPLAYTDQMTYGSQRQETTLIPQEFQVLEGKPSTSIKRDSYSRGGKINGDWMKGSYLYLKLRKTNASSLVTLTDVSIRFVDSPLNVTA